MKQVELAQQLGVSKTISINQFSSSLTVYVVDTNLGNAIELYPSSGEDI